MAFVDSTIAPSVASETSKEACNYLHTTYANRSQTRIYSLRDALAKVQRDKKSVIEYLREIRTITDELAAADARTSNEELIVKILSGLGPKYEALSIVIRSRDYPISYEELTHKLIDHEFYLKQAEKKQPVIPYIKIKHKVDFNRRKKKKRIGAAHIQLGVEREKNPRRRVTSKEKVEEEGIGYGGTTITRPK